MNFRAHNYEEVRAEAEKRSKEAGKKLLPLLGYSDGVPHYLMETGQHRRADFKRRDVSGKTLRRERIERRAKFRDYRAQLVAKFGEAKAEEIINAALAAAKNQPKRAT